MGIASTARRFGLTVAGVVGAAAVCVACGSSTSGSPASGSISLGDSSITVPSDSGSTPVDSLSAPAIPSATIPSVSLGGDAKNTPFCKDIIGIDPSSLTADPKAAYQVYDKLLADAPAEIKPDVQKIRDFLKAIADGKADPSQASQLQSSITKLGTYTASHCLG